MLELSAPQHIVNTNVQLSGSKSISNRWLMLQAILNLSTQVYNISNSEDTQLLKQALEDIKCGKTTTINVNHAGTDIRFLTSFLSVSSGTWILTGSERLRQRPIGDLVEALKSLGATISYTETEGFPPLLIKGKKLSGGHVTINASVSSQFISSLLLISVLFSDGLELELEGPVVSRPYIKMTIEVLKQVGVTVEQVKNKLLVAPNQIIHAPHEFLIESDWSSASYWYSICALAPKSKIKLNHFQSQSWQADAILPKLYSRLGVTSSFNGAELTLVHTGNCEATFEYDFSDCPDIAQTLAVSCFGLGIEAFLTGLSTLKHKETDRITALKTELEKLGACVEASDNSLKILKGKPLNVNMEVCIQTYQDHRMALSFAPLSLVFNKLSIIDEMVVIKSYPQFWEDLKNAGFSVNLQA